MKHKCIKEINGVKAMVAEWHGKPVVKYAELPGGAVRLLWVADGHLADLVARDLVS